MDEQTAAFFMPAEADDLPPVSDVPIIMAPPVDEGYEFAGGPNDGGGEEDFAAPPSDDIFFAGPPPTPADSGVLVLEDPNQPSYDYAPPAAFEGETHPLVEEVELEEQELSPMAKWNQEWQGTLKERKEAENAAKGAQVEAARKEMDEFHAQREMKRETKMSRNRSEEQSKLEAMEADLENDNSWQRVIKLVEFQQDSVEGGEDITRMRDIMITLKNDTTRAVALS